MTTEHAHTSIFFFFSHRHHYVYDSGDMRGGYFKTGGEDGDELEGKESSKCMGPRVEVSVARTV